MLQETLDRYQAGIQITEFNLDDVNVPAQVREAYSDVIRAREDRERFIEEARVHANSVVPEARGQAARVIQEAEGYKAATVRLAEGEAQRFTCCWEYRKAPEITRKRLYLQTMENVFARSQKVLLDADSSGNVLVPAAGSAGWWRHPAALDAADRYAGPGPVGENSATAALRAGRADNEASILLIDRLRWVSGCFQPVHRHRDRIRHQVPAGPDRKSRLSSRASTSSCRSSITCANTTTAADAGYQSRADADVGAEIRRRRFVREMADC